MPDQMRDALTAAYEKHASDHVEEAPAPVEAPAAEAAPTPDPAPKVTESAAAAVPAPPVQDGGEKPTTTASAPPTSPNAAPTPATPAAAPAAKAPRSWSAEAKAAFASLPEHVKQDVLRREKEISQGLEIAAPARKHFEAFNEVVKPFQPLFDAYGVSDPLPAIKELLTARATLEIGSPEQKAAFLANLIHEFGVDVQVLDNLLVKRGPVKDFAPARPVSRPDFRQFPELQPLFALAEQAKAAVTAKAEAAIAEAETLPHFDELRDDMADIIESFHRAGKTITVPQAHARALAMNPHLDPGPAAVPQISKSQAAAILASRNAASTIAGAPRTGAAVAPTDRRGQIAAAWDRQG